MAQRGGALVNINVVFNDRCETNAVACNVARRDMKRAAFTCVPPLRRAQVVRLRAVLTC